MENKTRSSNRYSHELKYYQLNVFQLASLIKLFQDTFKFLMITATTFIDSFLVHNFSSFGIHVEKFILESFKLKGI